MLKILVVTVLLLNLAQAQLLGEIRSKALTDEPAKEQGYRDAVLDVLVPGLKKVRASIKRTDIAVTTGKGIMRFSIEDLKLEFDRTNRKLFVLVCAYNPHKNVCIETRAPDPIWTAGEAEIDLEALQRAAGLDQIERVKLAKNP